MAFYLNTLEIKSPTNFRREYIETATTHTMIDGRVKRQWTRRKERFILEYQNIYQIDKTTILEEFDVLATHTFEVNEGSELRIYPTTVLMDIKTREYNAGGEDFREDFTVIFTEVE